MTKIRYRTCWLSDLGIVPYVTAWEKMRSLVQERVNNPHLPDILLLLEHPPVYTLGTGSDLKFVKFNLAQTEKEIHRIERGGEVTYHCPGQLIGYPILNLRYYQQDLHWYLRQLEEVIIRLLRRYDLDAYRLAGLTGVWLEGYKIAAIGIKVTRWITMHGFSINVSPDLSGFKEIIPCGIEDKPVGNIVQFQPHITMEQVKRDIALIFAEVFRVSLEQNKNLNY